MRRPATTPSDYSLAVPLHAAPEAVFDALVGPELVSRWWSTTTGTGDVGGTLRVTFGDDPRPLVLHVERARRPTLVEWSVVECDLLPDWVGTRITFAVDPGDQLVLRHHGLHEGLGCFETCRQAWEHFLPRLVQLAGA